MIDQEEFAKVLAFIASAWPRHELKPNTIKVYHRLLGDLDPALLKAAALEIGAESTFFPAAAEIRAKAYELIEMGSNTPAGYEAFAEVMQAVARFGVYRAPEFSHALIAGAVDAIGGWRVICMSDESDMPSTRARFIAAYDTLLKRAQTEARMLPEVRRIVKRLAADGNRPALESGDAVE